MSIPDSFNPGLKGLPVADSGELPATRDLTGEERQQILVEWNRTARAYPPTPCIHQLFEAQVERTPEAVAAICGKASITYRELNRQANQLAHYLRSQGVGPESLIGLCVNRSPALLVGLMGILKSGAAYVPMDPAYPWERLAFILQDSRASHIVTQESCRAIFEDSPTSRLVMIEALPAGGNCNNPILVNHPGHLAYIIYTSGSTGVPKGVAIEHRNTLSFLHWMRETFTDEELSGILAATSICFDLSIFEIFGALSWGGRVILAGNALEAVADGHWQAVRMINTVPSVMETWLRMEIPAPERVTVCLGGEFLQPALVETICRQWSLRRVNDLYGPTETTTYSTWTTREPAQRATIGRPIANTQIYILDAGMNPLPPGHAGEIWIGGAGVARGYLHRPELTAERFVPDPFSADTQARLYRTGDLGRYRDDGAIECLGRQDHQVKIRGFRIELTEIEAVLRTHPGLVDCAVVAQSDGSGGRSLTGFFVARQGAEVAAGSLRLWLAGKLPDYMIPSRLVPVPALPLTQNGKLDRKSLTQSLNSQTEEEPSYVAPRSERERDLAAIWRELLCREQQIGVKDDFFSLGGHSLLAAILCARISSLWRMEVPLCWVFEHPTIEALALRMESGAEDPANSGPIEKADRSQPLPVSFSQQQMWLLRETASDPATYNEPLAFHLSGPVDRERVRQALRAVMDRHEVLRTSLVLLGEDLVQRVDAAAGVSLPWREADLRTVPSDQQAAALARCLRDETRQSFDLARAPAWRALWIDLADGEKLLAFTFHHSLVDEWSFRLFSQEWQRLYAAGGRADQAGLPDLPVQYADYAVWQRRRLTADLLTPQRAYWKDRLRDLPPALPLPADRVRPPRPSGAGAVHSFRLSGPVTARLRELARQEKTTLFTVVLAAFHLWLHRCTGQTDVVVATSATNRERPEVQALLGYFLNVLPIRVRLEGSLAFRQVLGRVRAALLEAFRHADLPFAQMVEMSVRSREPGQTSLYQVMFDLLMEGVPAARLDQAEVRPVPLANGTSKCDLMLSVLAVDPEWTCQFEYSTDLFTAASAAGMAADFAELLQALGANPEEPLTQPEAALHALPAMAAIQAVASGRPGQGGPKDLLELELIRLWQGLFNRLDIDRQDNFFEIGGHSLLAARLAVEIEKLIGHRLPLAALFQSPTVESLARRLTDEHWAPPWSSLVPLQPLGSKPPLFLVHGWGGDVYVFLDLARHLSPDQPVYGIQAVDLDGRTPPHLTVEKMAEHYIGEIQSFHPEGPYFLGGYSVGGVIALEVARQLHQMGKRVALLALLDTQPAGPMPWFSHVQRWLPHLRARCRFHLQKWRNIPGGERLSYLQGRLATLCQLMASNRAPLPPAPPVLGSAARPALLEPDPDDHYTLAAAAYQVHPYPGSVDFLFCDETSTFWKKYWQSMAQGGVSLHRIQGKHLEILSPEHLQEVSKILKTAIERVHA